MFTGSKKLGNLNRFDCTHEKWIEVRLLLHQLPRFHRFAFWYAWNGFRSPQLLWRLVRLLRRVGTPSTVRLPNGFPLVVNDKDWISKTIYEGTYERSLLHFLESLELSDRVLDVGANIGVTLWHSLKNSPPDAHFLAFEPSKQCSDGLRLTTSHVNRGGSILDFAIGDSNGIRTIYGVDNDAHSGGASLIQHSGLRGHSEKIEVRTLDSVLNNIDSNSIISMLKIDTEGFEAQVIAGATTLLASQRIEMLVMEVSPNFGEIGYLNDVHRLLGKRYMWFYLDETGWMKRHPLLKKISVEQSLELSFQWNLILIREDIFRKYASGGHAYMKATIL